ncbi:putative aldehyde dehydrogenase [Rhizophagus irregularis]|uniref:Putative aldehyde dehydrogenase n=1 Tax=Rhizophagus irregularis TaxID=588596 RepID=A0A2N0QHI7_9GLOM|nr:putative aldehyde dehydrogenase [Rhizophagus irregularis]
MGPSKNKTQFESVVSYIEEAKADGISLLYGGENNNENGYFIEPTIFEVENNQLKLVQEEIFGPVISIMKYSTFDEAIALSNETKYGLSASLFSNDIKEIMQFVRDIEVGMVRVNAETSGVELHAPFGGLKDSSSYSREQGRAAMDFYTSIKTVFIK